METQRGSFLIHRKLRPKNQKALRAGCASRGEEVSCKQHRSSAKESQATLCSVTGFYPRIRFTKCGIL
ncbi:hypothetical protein DXA60_03335 [Roseburia sp. OF03-24]|nr:hypothetical protein DXA60_03335 [Roseburia sp. OF03-24]RHF96460.1 hypothetical protein DW650_04860 [Roseburia sp. AM23-20]